jgi:EAL domain-containing protein (putative c-di-GMP-specific phosphodiesterase class I)
LIKPLTLYVIDEALRQSSAWGQRGHAVTIAVNISPRSLIDAEFPHDVERLLRKWGVAHDLLELEITEDAIVADPRRVQAVLEQLNGMGIRLAVDDFGTGYSSLAYLTRLPIDEIKIDRSFVTSMSSSEDDAIIVRSTIELGRNLGLQVVAEGVEDAPTWTRLRDLGCDVAQGYHVSRPIPPEELTAWLESLPRANGAPQWLAPAALVTP